MKPIFCASLLLCLTTIAANADGPADNQPEKVRPVPPPGIKIADDDKEELATGIARLGTEIETLRTQLKGKPLSDLLPDVQIFHNAVRYALLYNEFYKSNELAVARRFLKQGMDRAQLLREGKAPWTTTNGLIVRGYLSRVDGSVQPYGLVIPASYQGIRVQPFRLDFWFHGRGETLTELDFINGRQSSAGEFTPPNTFVLHLYGRYCNGNRFAGETDLFEALENVHKYYPIDHKRLVVRGFSLGGAACWHMATHHAGLWAAAAPGAGFSETADFLKVFQKETLQPTWYEQELWHMYDSTDHALNLFNCPTVAYSGEIDSQKQAADMMVKAAAAEGMQLTHIIGPKTPHRYELEAKKEINRRIDAIAEKGKNSTPRIIHFTTWTLRYNQMLWIAVDGLEQHWKQARVDAEYAVEDASIKATTKNVTAFTFNFGPGEFPLELNHKPKLIVDGQTVEGPSPMTDRSYVVQLRKQGRRWEIGAAEEAGLRKAHGLQGPIDDAFMSSFLNVRPTGQPLNEKIGAWTAAEMAHATNHWRKQFRGEPRVKNDEDVTDADIAEHNLVLWGDPTSNKVLARLAEKLPVQWTAQGIELGRQHFDASHHVPVMIYPNPLNPKKYVVLNSGFTFREYDYLNNARQTSKLPDYAIVDVNVPVSSRFPGGIAEAGFFGESWELTSKR
ncbi:MAG TPA: prolyl oligopeptidase family serine peptidase [Candidatus Saccharimonadales bacterium]|nr:prolyl oligopeptidase family serine peptidase [Candidatus Saccharimonadales bacterium]